MRHAAGYNAFMSIKEIETAALKLVPKDRARLAGKLLESLEDLSKEENEFIWAKEAERRNTAWDENGGWCQNGESSLS